MQIELIFPTAIGFADYPYLKDLEIYKKEIANYKYESSGFCRERIHKNKKFKKLNDWILNEVHKYAEAHLYKDRYECKESWLLDYPVGGGQSFHIHPGFIFSAVFFIEGHKEDTSLNFDNPVMDMMNPSGHTAHDDGNVDKREFNQLTFRTISYQPITGRLLVWRSYLSHGCYNKVLNCKRIVFTYNFGKK